MNRVNSRSGFELRWQHHKYCRCYYYYYYSRRSVSVTILPNESGERYDGTSSRTGLLWPRSWKETDL